MQPLTKESEAKIQAAIEQLCRESDGSSGSQLKSAAVKIARDHQFGPDMIRLMCLGYNNGMSTHVAESGNSILEKLAEFPLLNPQHVIHDVYRGSEKVASTDVSHVYDLAPKNPNSPAAKTKAALLRTKLATAFPSDSAEEEPEETLEASTDGDTVRLLGRTQQLQHDIDTARGKWAAAQDDLRDAILGIQAYFKRSEYDRRWNIGNVEYAVVSRYGRPGQELVDRIKAACNYTVTSASPPNKPVRWTEQPFAQINACLEKSAEVAKLRQDYVDTLVDNRCKIAEMNRAAFGLDKPQEKVPDPNRFISFEKAAVGQAAINFSVVAGALKNLLGNPIQAVPRKDLVQGTLDDLADPDHEEALRRIRAQTMLQRFLTDDPVLSTHDPEQVMTAFNELSSLSPRTSQQPAASRSILRKWMTQGAVEPFEAREITDLERNLSDIQGVPKATMPKAPSPPEKVANVLARRNSLVG